LTMKNGYPPLGFSTFCIFVGLPALFGIAFNIASSEDDAMKY